MTLNPKSDLVISRLIRAPLDAVWDGWADPKKFAQWWLPQPLTCKVVAMDLTAGGPLHTEMSEDGEHYQPQLDACFLIVEPMKRIVFTTALTGGWRPADKPFIAITALMTFEETAGGVNYVSTVLHGSAEAAAQHAEMGFYDGWGTVMGQLAGLVERPS